MKDLSKILARMWKNPRQKALLKLGMWGLFFLILTLIVSLTNQFSKVPSTPPTPPTKEPIPSTSATLPFPELKELWTILEEKDYKYKFQVIDLETQEKITYDGEKKEQKEIGYRESKLGIIKYRIEAEKTYQVLGDTEEETLTLYKEEDIPFLKRDVLKEKINVIPLEENILSDTRFLSYQNETERIVITTTREKITSIEITTNTKNYKLEFE